MPELIIKIKDKIAKPLNNCVICDNSDYTVKFIFDEEWEKEPLRIARFIWNKQYVDVQFTGDTCEVPVVSKTNNLAIGVYAGDLRTTTPAILTCYTSILSEDVIEHSVTPSEYEEIMKLLNAQATDIAALKATDKRIWTNLDTINRTASTAKVKAEEGVAKADDALTATRTNADNINSLRTDVNSLTTNVNALKATDERIWTNLDTINRTASTAKLKAEEGVAKADSALARNIFTDEEKAKLASITNPIIIKGRVDTVNDLPTEAEIGWFYFVGLESASSYEEYCYSENGWEYIGLSQEGVDLSNYYTKKQVDTTINELKAIDNSLGTRIDNVDSKASAAKIKAEEGVAKADNALAAAGTNATNINSLQTDVNSLSTDVNTLKTVDNSLSKRIDRVDTKASTAKTKAEEGVAKADNALTATGTNAANISTHETRLDSIDNTLSSHDTRITTAQQKANSVDEKVDSTNEVVGQLSTSLQSAYNKINAHANDIAINRTTLGTQCKNLLKNNAVTKTVNGVTFTVNSDGTITANGTATSRIIFLVGTAYISQTGNYTYTGTPSGGAASTYSMNYRNSNVYKTVETGNGITTQFEGGKTYEAVIDIRSGVTISNLTFSPMLRDADITDDTYEPYKENVNKRLIKNKSDIAVNKTTLGYQCKNLLNETEYLASIKTATNGTLSKSGNSITLTATSNDCYTAPFFVGDNGYRIPVSPNTTYILSWESDNSNSGIIHVFMNGIVSKQQAANNSVAKYLKFTTDIDATFITIRFSVRNSGDSITYSNIMLRYADITDDTYEPYKESVDERLIKNNSNIAINKTTLGTQCKNLLKNTAVTTTKSGITFTVNSDGSVTVNGTNTSSSSEYIQLCGLVNYGNSKLIASIGQNTTDVYMAIYDSDWNWIGTGSAGIISFENSSKKRLVRLAVKPGATINNVTVYPMIRYADITDGTYEPYKETVDERLIKNKSDIAVNKTTLGYQGKNLLKLTLTTKTVSGITFTVNDDYSITLNGTATAIIWQEIGAIGGNNFRKEKLIFTGNPAGTGSGAGLEAWYMNSTTGNKYVSIANGNILTESDYDPSGAISYEFHINKGRTYNNVTFYPMLRYADIIDNTYEPYKSSVDARINTINSKINGAYFPLTTKKLIADSTDLNTLTEIGNYICYTASSAATMVNCPTKAGGFKLVVTNVLESSDNNTTIRYQWIIPNNLSDVLCFRRRIDMSTDTFSNWYSFKSYQPGLQEQIPYSISVSGKSTSAAISYNGVPTLICLTPNTADSTTGGLYMINSAGAVVKLIEKTGVVVAAASSSKTFTITNNTSTVMDVCISCCWGR